MHTAIPFAPGSLVHSGLLDPRPFIDAAGVWGLLVVCAIAFAETALLIGFFLPGDTLLFLAGVLTLTGHLTEPLWVVIGAIAAAAIIGEQVGYLIGWKSGPAIFERRESGLFSRASVKRTEGFFTRYGSRTILLARFIPVVRTFAPVAAGVGQMRLRVFTLFNVIGATVWSVLVVGAGFVLGHVAWVAGFILNDLDLILAAVVIVSLAPVVVRSIVLRARRHRANAQTPPPASE